MEDIGDFVVLKQLVTFVHKYLEKNIHIYISIAHIPFLFNFLKEKMPANMDEQSKGSRHSYRPRHSPA